MDPPWSLSLRVRTLCSFTTEDSASPPAWWSHRRQLFLSDGTWGHRPTPHPARSGSGHLTAPAPHRRS